MMQWYESGGNVTDPFGGAGDLVGDKSQLGLPMPTGSRVNRRGRERCPLGDTNSQNRQ